MQLHSLIFFAAQILASGYAVRRGGAPERIAAVVLAIAAILSTVLPSGSPHAYQSVNWRLFGIDVALLLVLVGIAMLANRYWPMWLAAVQLDSVMAHAVKAFDPGVWAFVYSRMTALPAYPILALLVIGTARHHHRTRSGDREADWIPVRASSPNADRNDQ